MINKLDNWRSLELGTHMIYDIQASPLEGSRPGDTYDK